MIMEGCDWGSKGGEVAGLHTPACPSKVSISQLGAACHTAGEAAAAALSACNHDHRGEHLQMQLVIQVMTSWSSQIHIPGLKQSR